MDVEYMAQGNGKLIFSPDIFLKVLTWESHGYWLKSGLSVPISDPMHQKLCDWNMGTCILPSISRGSYATKTLK